LVRANVKREVNKQIDLELSYDNQPGFN